MVTAAPEQLLRLGETAPPAPVYMSVQVGQLGGEGVVKLREGGQVREGGTGVSIGGGRRFRSGPG